MKKPKIKFEFTPEFQLEILRYIIRDREGALALNRIKANYFVLIEHGLIAEAIQKYVSQKKKVPSENILKQLISDLLSNKKYIDLVTKDDVPNIKKLIHELYTAPFNDGEYIKEQIYKFATYVEMKNLNESFDLNAFDQYEEYARKVDRVLQNSKPKQQEEPAYLIRDVVDRQFKRQVDSEVIPSPYWQLNALTNAGGFPRGSVLVLLDKPKAKKTFFLVNLARGYLRMKKSVLYIDTENGKAQIMDRMVQASINHTKRELYSGEFDKQETKFLRKLSRLGVEFVVDRVSALVTDCNYIRDKILKLRAQGINIEVLMVDYAAKLMDISKTKDEFERISNIYVELQNLANEFKLDIIWTANHITREGGKHRSTRYQENDIAKCIDIVRHSQGIYGLNATEEELRDNIQRLEVVVQRDGAPSGRALFKVDVEKQRAVEFTRDQRKAYDELYAQQLDESIKKSDKESKKEKRDRTGDI